MAFQSQIKIHFEDADPAGIAFFGGIFAKVHHCYEDFIEAMGIPLESWFINPKLIAPIRHLETDYFAPLLPFQSYDVTIDVLKISQSSFQLRFTVGPMGNPHCKVTTTHVCYDKETKKKVDIPEKLKAQLSQFLVN